MTQVQPIKRRRGRPRKDQAGLNETREALLRSGVELLTEKGFSATGIDEFLRRINVPKGSFYHYFGSKEAFGTELIEHYASYFAHKLDSFLLDHTLPPLQRLRAFVDDAQQGMARFDYTRGCLVGNLGQEMGSLPETYRAQLLDVFDSWQAKVEQCLLAVQAQGQIAADTDCKALANLFWIGWEGAVLRAKLERSSQPLTAFADYFFNNLN